MTPLLNAIANGELSPSDPKFKVLQKRKLATQSNLTSYSASKGTEFAMTRKQFATDLTAESMKRFVATNIDIDIASLLQL